MHYAKCLSDPLIVSVFRLIRLKTSAHKNQACAHDMSTVQYSVHEWKSIFAREHARMSAGK